MSEGLAACFLLNAKLQMKQMNFEAAIELCRKSQECGLKNSVNARRVCETHYIKGICYYEMKNKEKSFQSFKSARKLVDHIKDPKESLQFMNLIDDALMDCCK